MASFGLWIPIKLGASIKTPWRHIARSLVVGKGSLLKYERSGEPGSNYKVHYNYSNKFYYWSPSGTWFLSRPHQPRPNRPSPRECSGDPAWTTKKIIPGHTMRGEIPRNSRPRSLPKVHLGVGGQQHFAAQPRSCQPQKISMAQGANTWEENLWTSPLGIPKRPGARPIYTKWPQNVGTLNTVVPDLDNNACRFSLFGANVGTGPKSCYRWWL